MTMLAATLAVFLSAGSTRLLTADELQADAPALAGLTPITDQCFRTTALGGTMRFLAGAKNGTFTVKLLRDNGTR